MTAEAHRSCKSVIFASKLPGLATAAAHGRAYQNNDLEGR